MKTECTVTLDNAVRFEDKVTLKELRATFYECRNFELSYFWQRSAFLLTILTLCFTGYGILLFNVVEKNAKTINALMPYNFLAVMICALGLLFSVLWICLAKGSKAWYELYEAAICEIEREKKDLQIPEKYIMGELPQCDFYKNFPVTRNLFSGSGGPFSPAKTLIVAGQISLATWTLALVAHSFFAAYMIVTKNPNAEKLSDLIREMLPVVTVLIGIIIPFAVVAIFFRVKSTYLTPKIKQG